MNEHDKNCGCGCNEEEEMTVTLTLEDDTEVTCDVVAIFPAGGKDYIALLPQEGPASEEGEVYLYRFLQENEDAEPQLSNIDDDEEYEIAADAFDMLLDDAELDELTEE
ncbi:hypothetical protein lbkm_3918 [Lachnospiraceae bacterium KM106-2]|nr:hypothetical protein lbkm_3918 [Lachnospiraceae bacterium KM106-2]